MDETLARRLRVVGLILALALAGCSGDDDPAEDDGADDPAPEPGPEWPVAGAFEGGNATEPANGWAGTLAGPAGSWVLATWDLPGNDSFSFRTEFVFEAEEAATPTVSWVGVVVPICDCALGMSLDTAPARSNVTMKVLVADPGEATRLEVAGNLAGGATNSAFLHAALIVASTSAWTLSADVDWSGRDDHAPGPPTHFQAGTNYTPTVAAPGEEPATWAAHPSVPAGWTHIQIGGGDLAEVLDDEDPMYARYGYRELDVTFPDGSEVSMAGYERWGGGRGTYPVWAGTWTDVPGEVDVRAFLANADIDPPVVVNFLPLIPHFAANVSAPYTNSVTT